jgi:hypothetical protein
MKTQSNPSAIHKRGVAFCDEFSKTTCFHVNNVYFEIFTAANQGAVVLFVQAYPNSSAKFILQRDLLVLQTDECNNTTLDDMKRNETFIDWLFNMEKKPFHFVSFEKFSLESGS